MADLPRYSMYLNALQVGYILGLMDFVRSSREDDPVLQSLREDFINFSQEIRSGNLEPISSTEETETL